jgi:hypothetical protein
MILVPLLQCCGSVLVFSVDSKADLAFWVNADPDPFWDQGFNVNVKFYSFKNNYIFFFYQKLQFINL